VLAREVCTFEVREIVEMGGQNAAATVVLELSIFVCFKCVDLKPCPIPGLIFSFPDKKFSRAFEASSKSARLQSGFVTRILTCIF
jgi:hypothetical protein